MVNRPRSHGEGPVEGDPLRVRTWPERVIVELVENPFGTDYITLDERGAMITLSAERVALNWVELRQLMAVVAVADRTFNRKKED